MVREREFHLAVRHRLVDGRVVRVRDRLVREHSLEPGAGGFLPVEQPDRGHERLEGPVGGRPADPALPARVGEALDGVRQVLGGQEFGVVDEDPGASGGSHPAAVRIPEPGRHPVEDGIRERAQAALAGELAERAGVLAVVHVRRTLITLFQNLRSEVGGAAVADLHLDSGLRLKRLDHRAHQRFAPPAVDRQRLGFGSASAAGYRDEDNCGGRQFPDSGGGRLLFDIENGFHS